MILVIRISIGKIDTVFQILALALFLTDMVDKLGMEVIGDLVMLNLVIHDIIFLEVLV
jgi:hypothetical protein